MANGNYIQHSIPRGDLGRGHGRGVPQFGAKGEETRGGRGKGVGGAPSPVSTPYTTHTPPSCGSATPGRGHGAPFTSGSSDVLGRPRGRVQLPSTAPTGIAAVDAKVAKASTKAELKVSSSKSRVKQTLSSSAACGETLERGRGIPPSYQPAVSSPLSRNSLLNPSTHHKRGESGVDARGTSSQKSAPSRRDAAIEVRDGASTSTDAVVPPPPHSAREPDRRTMSPVVGAARQSIIPSQNQRNYPTYPPPPPPSSGYPTSKPASQVPHKPSPPTSPNSHRISPNSNSNSPSTPCTPSTYYKPVNPSALNRPAPNRSRSIPFDLESRFLRPVVFVPSVCARVLFGFEEGEAEEGEGEEGEKEEEEEEQVEQEEEKVEEPFDVDPSSTEDVCGIEEEEEDTLVELEFVDRCQGDERVGDEDEEEGEGEGGDEELEEEEVGEEEGVEVEAGGEGEEEEGEEDVDEEDEAGATPKDEDVDLDSRDPVTPEDVNEEEEITQFELASLNLDVQAGESTLNPDPALHTEVEHDITTTTELRPSTWSDLELDNSSSSLIIPAAPLLALPDIESIARDVARIFGDAEYEEEPELEAGDEEEEQEEESDSESPNTPPSSYTPLARERYSIYTSGEDPRNSLNELGLRTYIASLDLSPSKPYTFKSAIFEGRASSCVRPRSVAEIRLGGNCEMEFWMGGDTDPEEGEDEDEVEEGEGKGGENREDGETGGTPTSPEDAIVEEVLEIVEVEEIHVKRSVADLRTGGDHETELWILEDTEDDEPEEGGGKDVSQEEDGETAGTPTSPSISPGDAMVEEQTEIIEVEEIHVDEDDGGSETTMVQILDATDSLTDREDQVESECKAEEEDGQLEVVLLKEVCENGETTEEYDVESKNVTDTVTEVETENVEVEMGSEVEKAPTTPATPQISIDPSTLSLMLRMFADDSTGGSQITLPPMDEQTREKVHELAPLFGLKSYDEGEGGAHSAAVIVRRISTETVVGECGVAVDRPIATTVEDGVEGNDVRGKLSDDFVPPNTSITTTTTQECDFVEAGNATPTSTQEDVGSTELETESPRDDDSISGSNGADDDTDLTTPITSSSPPSETESHTSNHPAAKVDPTSDPIAPPHPNRTIDVSTLHLMLRMFVNDSTGGTQTTLPPMDEQTRRKVHELAPLYGLKSLTDPEGEGDARCVTITRTKKGAVNEKKLAKAVRKAAVEERRDMRDEKKRAKVAEENGLSGLTSLLRAEKEERNKRRDSERGTESKQSYKEGAVVGMAAPEISATNVGFRMLAMMGWNNGEKIGVSGQGLNKPLAVIVKRTKRGLGMEKKWDA